ncbi:MAG: peptidase domain-containing ABC transporter [Gemmataceae bacterium]|nr:peptidase domain-containing ABC transporter [Gemmataceae bacterium]
MNASLLLLVLSPLLLFFLWPRRSGFAFLRQDNHADCGPACVQMVLAFHGLDIPLNLLRHWSLATSQGTSLESLIAAFSQAGFQAKAHAIPDPCQRAEVLPLALDAHGPLLLHVQGDGGNPHFVVLYRISDGLAVLGDPELGRAVLPVEDLARRMIGRGLLLSVRAVNPRLPAGATPAQGGGILSLLAGHGWTVAVAFLASIAFLGLGMLSSYLSGLVFDLVLGAGDRPLLWIICSAAFAALLFKIGYSTLRDWLLLRVGCGLAMDLEAGYADHLNRMRQSALDRYAAGDLASRYHDAGRVRRAVTGAVALAADFCFAAVVLVLLFRLDAWTAGVQSGFVLAMVGVLWWSWKPLRERSEQAMAAQSRFEAHQLEDIQNPRSIRASRAGSQRAAEARVLLAHSNGAIRRHERLVRSVNAWFLFLAGSAVLTAVWLGSLRVLAGGEGAWTLGQLVFACSLGGFMYGPLERAAAFVSEWQDGRASLDRFRRVMAEDAERQGGTAPARLQDAVLFAGVGLRYDYRNHGVSGLDLELAVGLVHAIVGPSGCGKSTALQLLMGYYEASEGAVLIDGTDLRRLDLEEWRGRIGYAPQSPELFNYTIAENIALGRPGATRAQIEAAARAARMHEWVLEKPGGYDSMVLERGANLSGGQRQRLGLARAILAGDEIDLLLLDEPGSALDPEIDRAVLASIRTHLPRATVVLVTHRLRVAADFADEIHVIEGGKRVGWGRHAALVATNDTYRRMWQAETGRTA